MSNKTEESKDSKDSIKKSKIPQSVINHYAKYRSTATNIKTFIVMGTRFDIEDKYEIIDSGRKLVVVSKVKVGQGAYGVVVAARDKSAVDQEQALIAIKKIEKAFEHKIFTKRTLRELKILRLLKHENVVLFYLDNFHRSLILQQSCYPNREKNSKTCKKIGNMNNS